MFCDIVRNPQGSFRVKFSGSVSEIEYLDKLKCWAKSHECVINDPSEESVDYSKVVKTASSQNPKRIEKKKKLNTNTAAFWYKWYEVLNEKHKDIQRPEKLPKSEAVLVSTILEEYGEEHTLEIFKVAVYDWDALRTRHDKLPQAPTLRDAFYYRRELSIGVTGGGITTSKQRVSEYRQSKGGDTSNDWDIKKQE